MAAQLRARGVPYVVLAPRITKVDGDAGSAYLSVFAREKTPLDRLFAGEKLFLAQDPIEGRVPLVFANAGAGLRSGIPTDVTETWVDKAGEGTMLVGHAESANGERLDVKTRDGVSVTIDVPLDASGNPAGPVVALRFSSWRS